MRIMEIVSNTGMNGAINHCLILTRELARRGHQMTLVCDPTAWIATQAAADGIDTIASDLHRWPLDELRRIAAITRQREIDVVHTHMSRAHFFGVLLRWLARVPSVATAQSRHFQLHWMFNDYVIAASEATRRYHQRRNFVRRNRIETIPNFVDLRPVSALPSGTRNRVRALLGLPESCPVLGVVGDVIPRKGLMYLISAFPRILRALPEARLLVVGSRGDDEYRRSTASMAEQLGVGPSIVWAGRRDDVHAMLAAMDIFVLPSLEETLPLAILEAMAAGLPVVATRVGGIIECVDEGVTGTLVRPEDSEALADAILPLLLDTAQARRFGEAGRRRAEREFSLESQASRLEGLFAQVVRGRREGDERNWLKTRPWIPVRFGGQPPSGEVHRRAS